MTDEEKKARKSEYNKRWYQEHKEHRKKYNAELRRKDPERTRARDRDNYRNRGIETQLYRERTRESFAIQQIVRKFNVKKEEATRLYVRARESCDCCGISWEESGQKTRFHVDHNHETGAVRGILCHHCNVTLGLLKEDRQKVLFILNYLEKEQRGQIPTRV